MKSTTWILITLAITVTASMVVAKSIIFVPQKAEAQPVQPAKVAMEPTRVQPVGWAVGQRAPRMPQTQPTPDLFEQAPTVGIPDAESEKANTWTVLVVNGSVEEHVTYTSPGVKSPTP